jgi:hypothetical protein
MKAKKKIEWFRWECAECKARGKYIHATSGDAARSGLLMHNKHRSGVIVESSNGRNVGGAVGINFHVTR